MRINIVRSLQDMALTTSMSNNFCFLVFGASLVIMPASSQGYQHVALFIFGDSFFDAGNNNYINNAFVRANFLPYGKNFFKHPTGRFSDGRIIPDFIAEHAKLPLIPPYLQPGNHQSMNGMNFASAGAGALVETHQGKVIDLKTQINYFKEVEKQLRQKLGDEVAKSLLSSALYLFSIGSNDYFVPFTTNSTVLQSYNRNEYVRMVIGNLTSAIQEIYKQGGRKFGILNLAASGCFPFLRALKQTRTRSSGCMDEVTVLTKLHNRELSKALKKLEKQLNGLKYSNFDFYTSQSERINNPSKYGFKEVKVACCGTGPYRGSKCGVNKFELCDNASEYLFFDGIHPTDEVHNQFAKLMWSGNPDVAGPYNLKTLFEE